MKGLRTWACQHTAAIHPDFETLVRYADGHAASQLQAHFARCSTCNETARRMQQAVGCSCSEGKPGTVAEAAILNDILEKLQFRIRAWRRLTGVAPRAAAPAGRPSHPNRDLAAAVEFYFGKGAALQLEESTRHGSLEFGIGPVAVPLFESFLGRKAACALANRIADLAA